MPPMGGAQLSPSDVSALAAYLAALNQRPEHGAGAAQDDCSCPGVAHEHGRAVLQRKDAAPGRDVVR